MGSAQLTFIKYFCRVQLILNGVESDIVRYKICMINSSYVRQWVKRLMVTRYKVIILEQIMCSKIINIYRVTLIRE